MIEPRMQNDQIFVNRPNKGVWMPEEILCAKGISLCEKTLWSIINNLFDKDRGGCYATNKYLCDTARITPKVLRRIHKL